VIFYLSREVVKEIPPFTKGGLGPHPRPLSQRERGVGARHAVPYQFLPLGKGEVGGG
jgi:hypothetical protein